VILTIIIDYNSVIDMVFKKMRRMYDEREKKYDVGLGNPYVINRGYNFTLQPPILHTYNVHVVLHTSVSSYFIEANPLSSTLQQTTTTQNTPLQQYT